MGAQGNIPRFAVQAETVSDVSAYVNFVVHYDLQPVVKNTGRPLGRSAGKQGFAIWTHAMKYMSYHDTFLSKGCPSSAQ